MGSFKVSGLPVKARLYKLDSWSVKATHNGSDIRLTISRDHIGAEGSISIWTVRDRFLEIKDGDDAVRFFRKFGPFERDYSRLLGRQALHPEETTEIDLSTVLALQKSFVNFTGRDVRKGLHAGQDSPTFSLELGHVPIRGRKVPSPYLNYEALDVSSAVFAAIYIDKMRGLEGRVCEREDCSQAFFSNDPRKRFHSETCSAVVRNREARAAAKLEGVSDAKA